jgi:hypothetical protein
MYVDDPIASEDSHADDPIRSDPIRSDPIRSDPIRSDSSKQASTSLGMEGWIDGSADLLLLLLIDAAATD